MAVPKFVPCYFHQDKEAVTRCITCGKALCSACAHTFDGEVYCSNKCAESAVQYEKESEELQELNSAYDTNEARSNKQGLVIHFILLFIGIIVAIIVWNIAIPSDMKQSFIKSIPDSCQFFKNFMMSIS